jgi:hypothetical protein
MRDDKIFNNRFNTGEMDFDFFGAITKINIEGDGSDDVYASYNEMEFQKVLYDIFKVAPFFTEYSKNKKVPRNEVAKIYYYFEERLPDNKELSKIDIFVNIAEFMSIEYHILYDELGAPSKESLLKELDMKYNIFERKKIHRLF